MDIDTEKIDEAVPRGSLGSSETAAFPLPLFTNRAGIDRCRRSCSLSVTLHSDRWHRPTTSVCPIRVGFNPWPRTHLQRLSANGKRRKSRLRTLRGASAKVSTTEVVEGSPAGQHEDQRQDWRPRTMFQGSNAILRA
jgi:hypothetical protein